MPMSRGCVGSQTLAMTESEPSEPSTNSFSSPWQGAKGNYWSGDELAKLVEGLNKYGYGKWIAMAGDTQLGFGETGRSLDSIETKIRRLIRKGFLKKYGSIWQLNTQDLQEHIQYNYDRMNHKLRPHLESPRERKDTQSSETSHASDKKSYREGLLRQFFGEKKSASDVGGEGWSPPMKMARRGGPWTKTEVKWLLEGINRYGVGNWTAMYGDPEVPWSEGGRKVHDLRQKFLKMKSNGLFVLDGTKWRIDHKTILSASQPPSQSDFEPDVDDENSQPIYDNHPTKSGRNKSIPIRNNNKPKRKKLYNPWTDPEIGALVEGLNRHGDSNFGQILRDEALQFNPKRRNLYILQTKFNTLIRHRILKKESSRWEVDYGLYHLITRRRKGLD